MFSGIIEEVGKIKKISPAGSVWLCEVSADKVFDGLKEGDSISVNGVCLTVERLKDKVFAVSLSRQTLKETNFSEIKIGDCVNLERALKSGERIGGHILTGHIDFKTHLKYLHKERDTAVMGLDMPDRFQRYVVCRGSIGVDGISLTVAELKGREIRIFIVPYTINHTNIRYRRPGDMLNIEVDITAKHIERILKDSDRERARRDEETF